MLKTGAGSTSNSSAPDSFQATSKSELINSSHVSSRNVQCIFRARKIFSIILAKVEVNGKF